MVDALTSLMSLLHDNSSTQEPYTSSRNPSEPEINTSRTTEAPSSSVWLNANLWVWRTVAPVVLLLGTFGNIMSIIVLRQLRSATSSFSLYLTALAITDTMALYFGVGLRWGKFVLNFNAYDIHALACKLGFWTLNFSAGISSWLLVAMSVHRAASVVLPHRVSSVCTRGKTKVVIATTAVALMLFYSHMLYGLDMIEDACGIVPDLAYRQFFFTTWLTLDLVVYSLLPFACLVFTNSVLIWHLLASVRTTTKTGLTSENSAHHVTQREKQASSTTLTIVVVSLTFLALSCPVVIFNTVARGENAEQFIEDPEQRTFAYEFSFLLTSCNFAVNFYLYCLTGARFRNQFLRIFRCWGCLVDKTARDQTVSENTRITQLSDKGFSGNQDNRDDEF